MLIKRVIFFGTSDFAVPSLKLLHSNSYDVVLVVTQSDQPKGRGQKLAAPPVKIFAEQANLKYIQPEVIREESFYAYLKSLEPDVIIVVSYGKILPLEILLIPPAKCINVHASLLPRYRGAAPIQWAILNGDDETGVTTMFMNEKMDEGDILLQERIKLKGNENAVELTNLLSDIGAKLLLETLEKIKEGSIIAKPQDHSIATYAPKIKKEDGLIDWQKPAIYIERMVRAFQPWPSAYSFYQGKLIKIWEAEALYCDSSAEILPATILEVNKDFITVKCGNNSCLRIKKLQLEGKNIMLTKQFLLGNKINAGEQFSGR
jgi:methionyl-tRNA formyltransferase